MKTVTRRQFARSATGAAALICSRALAPHPLIQAAAEADSGRILVVIELGGGNDGLNTVIPYSDDIYRKLRPKLAIPESEVLKIQDGLGFHAALRGFADLLERGQLSIVQGVGYPNPNRSHFESMDIWHTCQRKEEVRADGWLGRLMEQTSVSGSDPAGIHLGTEKQPFALMSRGVRIPSIRSLDQFRLNGAEESSFRTAIQELSEVPRDAADDLLGFVQSSTTAAIVASERLGAATKPSGSTVSFPQTQTGEQLQTVARLIASELKTSVYYLQLAGFDTHAQQPDVHRSLLAQLGDAVRAFVDEMTRIRRDQDVTVMCFSEFGRRVAENASDGTDHGTAGPVFFAGASLQPGLIGELPLLKDLEEGDLKFRIDFRQVYAEVIGNWFQRAPETILKGRFQPVKVFRS